MALSAVNYPSVDVDALMETMRLNCVEIADITAAFDGDTAQAHRFLGELLADDWVKVVGSSLTLKGDYPSLVPAAKPVLQRKRTVWDFCETHTDLVRGTDPRRFNFVTEGGPAELDPCSPRRCVVKPGGDRFADHMTDELMRKIISEWRCNTPAVDEVNPFETVNPFAGAVVALDDDEDNPFIIAARELAA